MLQLLLLLYTTCTYGRKKSIYDRLEKQHAKELEALNTDKEQLTIQCNALERMVDGARKYGELIQKIKSGRNCNLITQTQTSLLQAKVTLTLNEFYQFWTDLHIDNDVFFFRCTSRVNPVLWESPDMQLYEKRQIANIQSYNNGKDVGTKKELARMLRDKISSPLLDEKNFERIFVIDNEQRSLNNVVESLASTISRQIKGGICIRAICIKANERPTYKRPQDFGIVVTEKADKLLMYLEVSASGEPEGGQIIFDEDEIKQFEKRYGELRSKSKIINSSDVEEIQKEILSLPLSDIAEVYGSRCLECLRDAEDKVESGTWKDEKSPLRAWYEIIEAENNVIKEILEEVRPHTILEIACGPGRVVRQALKLKSQLGITRIIGYEQNPEICTYAQRHITDKIVDIYPVFVGKDASGRFKRIEERDIDLVLGVSNIVGWQEDEKEWIEEALHVGKNFFFTVYRRGVELERARMYKAAGDVLDLVNGEEKDIELIVDAFKGEKHITKAYTKEHLEKILHEIARDLNISESQINIFDVGKYMYGCLIRK